MKKIILLGVFISIGIILMASSASAVEYRAVIEQNTKEIISQETTNDIKTVSEKLTELMTTMKITHRIIPVLLILIFIKLIFSLMRTSSGIPVAILILILIIAHFSRFKFFRPILSLIRTIVKISGLILIQILKIIRFPFKLISKSITFLIRLIRLIILLPNIHIGIYHPLLPDITGRFS